MKGLCTELDLLERDLRSLSCDREETAASDEMIRQASTALNVGAGIALTSSQCHWVAAFILSRTLAEIIIKMKWATVSPENAEKLAVASQKEWEAFGRKAVADRCANATDRCGQDRNDEFVSMLKHCNQAITPNVCDMAKEAGLILFYRSVYSFLSFSVHGHNLSPGGCQQKEGFESVIKASRSMIEAVRLISNRYIINGQAVGTEELSSALGIDLSAAR